MSSTNPSPKTSIFKCDQHPSIVAQKLQNFYELNEFFDTVLIAGSNSVSIQVHRVVLCALSDYFLETFRGEQSALKGNVMDLKEIEAPKLKLIIDFMYSGSIELGLETVDGILRTASFLKIKSLVDGCCEFIEQNIDSTNSLKWFRFAYELSLPTLKSKTLECTYTNFGAISKEEELLKLSENQLKDLLFNDNPHRDDNEEDVFLAMVAWINHDKSNREHLVLQLLSMVRFRVLTPKFIFENRKSVCKTVESFELICSWLYWHCLSPETRLNDQPNCDFDSKKPSEKLAIVQKISKGKLSIKTYNAKANTWSLDIITQVPKESCYYKIMGIDYKVIVVGRNDLQNWIHSVQCFDLQTSQWSDLPSVKNMKEVWETADLNGNLCVNGIFVDLNCLIIELYNFSAREWHDLQPISPISFFSQIATHNEMLYIIDFDDGYLQSYSVKTKKWSLKNIGKEQMRNFCFTAVEGFLYIFGGLENYKGQWVNTVKRYNLSTHSWCEMGSLPNRYRSSYGLQSIVLRNKIIISDSFYFDEYNIDTNTWKTLSDCEKKRSNFTTFNIFKFTANK